jgi:hypothetical protein
MKARLVEDKQNFERNQHPRSAMGVGGIVYQDEFGKEFKEFQERWYKRLKKDLEGKTITTECTKYIDDSLSNNNREHGTWTFKICKTCVLEPGMNFDTTSKKNSGDLELSLWVLDEDGNRYNLGILDKKIYID